MIFRVSGTRENPKPEHRTDAVDAPTRASYVTEADALDHVAGFCLINDVSERAYQIERGGTWDTGKGRDTFGPIGPWLVTRDEVGDPQDLGMWLDVNGKRMQTGTTVTMIFSVATIVYYLFEFMTLMPGVVITTGTPPGLGMGMKPAPVYLKHGDTVELDIEKLGTQRQQVVAHEEISRLCQVACKGLDGALALEIRP